ncbi:MAG: hypothetical protein K1X65_16990, partial [Caldilineales bacterium]|nr:hypothetical protein [Caldilineales bacterium]
SPICVIQLRQHLLAGNEPAIQSVFPPFVSFNFASIYWRAMNLRSNLCFPHLCHSTSPAFTGGQ